MKVNILGTKYRIIIATNEEKPKLNECDGYMDPTIKEIVVGKFEGCPMSVEDLQAHTKNVMRHEITHAFLHESGLWTNSGNVENWGQSEEITDWIALQFPKMLKAFQKAKCI
ncbi:hypothetical protein [Blautia producta]|uniref:ImmA/IrrE family metallo-endopeptidase n=2 Tax=Blautia producta TaxID=33035 RepID=A0A7G5MXI9_9FIRM|nr:hypothetical protein [Blautia producta]QIB54817.1 hypothetical protein GXM18_08005 [Blautia producta ATCC 27340 = DSM 2950]QMW79332.1 hypothetical protein E5259_17950 [Blautia producta]